MGGVLVESSINTRRAAFEGYSNKAQSLGADNAPSHLGVSELQTLALRDSKVKKSMDLYGWHQGHKVFATESLAGLRLVANAGAMTFRSQYWRTCLVVQHDSAQVMTFPFAIETDNYEASLHVPDYPDWLYGRLMCPKQRGSDYRLGDKIVAEPPVYRVSQYLTILNDLVTEMLIPHCDIEQITTTYYQVRDSLINLINSPDYRGRSLPAQETVANVADKLATLLRDRDENPVKAREYVDYVNRLPAQAFFQAMRLIATDQVTVRDRDDQPVPSSTLFHHSVFYDGDLIYASRHLDSTGNADSLTHYWVKRNLQEALKHIPPTPLNQATSLAEAIETIHRQAGKKVESKLRHVYLQKLVQDEILSQPRLALESIKEIMPNLLALARETKGITSLMMAILPDMAEIPNLNQSLAELLLRAGVARDKNKLIIPIESLRQSLPPEQLTLLVQRNIDRLDRQQSSILSILSAPSTVARVDNVQCSVLQNFIVQFRKTAIPKQLHGVLAIDQSDHHVNDASADQPTKTNEITPEHKSLLRDSSGNQPLIEQLFDYIASLTMNRNFSELTALIVELRARESEKKRRLIGARRACRLVGRILQQQIALNQIKSDAVEAVFKQFLPILPTMNSYLSVYNVQRQLTGRNYVAQIIQALFKARTVIEDHQHAAPELIEFYPLPDCIARQRTRNQELQKARNNRQYECSICLESHAIPRLLNHNTSPLGQPEKNGHPGMPVCKPCVGRLLGLHPPRCPACRVAITENDYVPFLPDCAHTP